MSDRPKGVMVYSSPKNPIAEAAKQHQRQLQEERDSAAKRRYDNAPNTVCYADTAFKDWQPGMPIPKCLKCRGRLHPTEHHNCPGFIPRYRTNCLTPEERRAFHEAQMGNDGDWDDDQYDPTTPGDADYLMHEAETGETRDQVLIEGMTEEDYLMEKFGYIPSLEDFEE